MLSFRHFTNILLSCLCTLCMLSLVACGGDNPPQDSMEAAQQLNEPKADVTKESDERFLVKAAEMHLEGIILTKLARQRSVEPTVKEVSLMLEDAHRNAKSALSALARSKSIAIPLAATQNSQEVYNKLNEKSQEEFDMEFANLMVKSHKDAIDLYAAATRGNNDGDVKNFAVGMLHELRNHLMKSEELQSKLRAAEDISAVVD